MRHSLKPENDLAAGGRLAPQQGIDAYDLSGAAQFDLCNDPVTAQKVRFVSDHQETRPDAPKGARCLAKILAQAADHLCKSKEYADRRCVIKLRTVDVIAFDCTQPFLSTVLHELVLNAVQAKATQIEVIATEYQAQLFIQVADNGVGTPRLSADQSGFDRDQRRLAPTCWRPELRAACILVDTAGGSLEIVSTSALFGTRIGFCLPLLTTSEQLDE